jgi:YD repeat-containing protein
MIPKKILLVLVSLVVLGLALPCFAGKVSYEYDNLYRLTKATYPNGTVIEYSYDKAGNRLTKYVEAVLSVTAWKSPGSCASVDRDGGKEWNNPGYAQVSDDNKAHCDLSLFIEPTDWLQCSNFGFTTSDIPTGATIVGIEVQIERRGDPGYSENKIRDDALYLRGSGGQVGDNKAVTGTYWPTSDAYATYGGASDTWNAGLSANDIRDSSFGIDISALRDSLAILTKALIDHVRIRVFYTTGPAPAPTVSMSADPTAIGSGQSSTFTWSSTYADSCEIQPDVGPVDPNGSTIVSPTETTTYTITATGPGGTATDSVTVTVVGLTAWKSPGSCASVDRDGGNRWNNPSYAQVSDNNGAACYPDVNEPSDWLQCSNFGFTTSDIPSGATIVGIEVQIERTAIITNDRTKDDAIYLRDSGGQVGDNKAITDTYWPTSDAYATYGGASDTWNAGLSADDIRDSNFGLDISILRDAYTYYTGVWIDHVRIRVFFY